MQYIIYTSITFMHKLCLIQVHPLLQSHSSLFSSIQQKVKLLPTNRKVVSADSNRLGPIGEVHLKFKVGKIEFNDMFVILNNVQRDIILGLPIQCNYRIGCMWNREGKHFLTIKNKFLALSITPQSPKWLVNSLFEINLDRQLPKGLIPLDILHNIEHKQPQEMLISLLT